MALLEGSEAIFVGQQFLSTTMQAVKAGIRITYSTAKPLTVGTVKTGAKAAQLAASKIKDGSTKFKALAAKGDVHPIEVSNDILKDFKKDLKKRGVDFSVEKAADGKTYIHFIGKDSDTVKHALEQSRVRLEGKMEKKNLKSKKKPQTRADVSKTIQDKAQAKKAANPKPAMPKQTLKKPIR